MNRSAQRVELALSASVVIAFAAYWGMTVYLSDPPEYQSQYVLSAIAMTVLGAPFVVAVRLLWRSWWTRYGADLAAMDGPALLLAAAVATLPEGRAEWGRAMLAELAHVQSRSSRWSFAAGCALTAVCPPSSSRVPVLVVGAVAAAAVATVALAVRHTLPAMFVFMATFLSLVGALTILTFARSRGGRPRCSGLTIRVAGLAGVAACIVVTTWFLVRYPSAAEQFPAVAAVVLAVVLAAFLWLAATPPRALTTSPLAGGVGAGAAAIVALGFVLTSRLSIGTSGGPMIWVVIAPAVFTFAASAAAAVSGHSFRVGIQAAVWAALIGTLLVFAGFLPEASHRYAIDSRLLLDGESGVPVGVNLAAAVGILVLIPIQALPFGVIGASFGVIGSLREIGIKTPASPGIASVLLSLPFVAIFTIGSNDVEPFKTWFAQDQPLAPLGQLLIVGCLACLLLALLFALISMRRHLIRLRSLVGYREP